MALQSFNTRIRTAEAAWRCLQGVFYVHKPERMSMETMLKRIPKIVTEGLNERVEHKVPMRVEITGSLAEKNLKVLTLPDWSLHPNITGKMYLEKDITLTALADMHELACGVCVLGMNRVGRSDVFVLKKSQLVTTYVIEARLGVTTTNLFYTGKPIDKASFGHVTRGRMENAVAKLMHRDVPRMFEQMGVAPNSQQAYEKLARDGVARPVLDSGAVVYGVKLLKLDKPRFMLEVTGVNLNEDELLDVVARLASALDTAAHTIKLKCVRRGPFSDHSALLSKHWSLEHVLGSIAECQRLVPGAPVPGRRLLSLEEAEGEGEERLALANAEEQKERREDRRLRQAILQDGRSEELERYVRQLPPFRL